MREQVPPPGVGAEAVTYTSTEDAYLLALSGHAVPECEQRDIVLGLAVSMGIRVPGEGGSPRLPSPSKVAEGLRWAYPDLVDLHAAAEIQSGYKSPGAKAAKHTARAVGVLTTIVEVPFELTGNALRGKGAVGSAVGALARGVSNAFGLAGVAAHGAADHSRNNLTGAAYSYILGRYGAYNYSAARQAPWLWGSLIGRVSKIQGAPDAALVRLAVRFMDSYEASFRGHAVNNQVGRLYYHLAAFRPTFEKMVRILDSGRLLEGNALKASGLLAQKVRTASRPF